MSLYGEQLKTRLKKEQQSVKENEHLLANTVSARKSSFRNSDSTAEDNLRQIELIAEYFQLQVPSYKPKNEALPELIELILRPTGTSKRQVRLDGPWWKDSDGPLLVSFKGEERVLALFPDMFRGYYYRDQHTNEKIKIRKEDQQLFEETAYCFYRPLPPKPLSGTEFLKFIIHQIRTSDLIMYVLTSVFLALIGMLPTYVMQIAFSQIIPSQKVGMLISLFILLISTAGSSYLMRSARFSVNLRIQCRLDLVLENSIYGRILTLPASFFKNITAGALSKKVSELARIPKIIGDILMMMTSILISFVSAIPIFFIAPELAAPTIVCLLLSLALLWISMVQEIRLLWKEMSSAEENSGLVFGLISGMERLRVSGSEQRAYAKWLKVYAKKTGASFAVRFPLCVRNELIITVRLLGLLWAFLISWNCQLSVAQLAAFTSAFGIAISCIDTIANHGRNVSRLKPILERAAPILQAVPESSRGGTILSRLRGNIEISHVTFRYAADEPAILDDLSLNIRQGEYVAIVGKSGCGKTTLVKLLLGFETPERGTIAYDGNDLNALDPHSLRRNIGTVLQDGKLFAGDIYSNITITAPWLGMEEAWAAAEKVGLADDIRKMPAGMHTFLSEGTGGISGGQKQRLMIARAIVASPGVLILDEATSALDNLTQKIVTDSMDAMKCTRIVIAHRLSTIRSCDRIIALDQGRIVESGTYEELIARDGFFAELVKRQQLEDGA